MNISIFDYKLKKIEGEDLLSIQDTKQGQVSIIKVRGNMLDAEAQALSDKVKSLARQNVKSIVLDLEGVKLMNSCFGLGILAACWGCMNKEDGKLKIANPSQKVAYLLNITKLDQIFEVFQTVEEALGTF